MNIAIILAGGIGTRLGGDIPKQYVKICGKPIIIYCLEKFAKHEKIDGIVIVAAENWYKYIETWIDKEKIDKFQGFAPAGGSRQQSIFNGMRKAFDIGATEEDYIVIHDAARPNVSEEIISQCIEKLECYDGVMPVLPVKDTIYLSEDGKNITSLLNRDYLFAGQAPESFNLGKYYRVHVDKKENELALVRGSSEIGYKNGLKICLILGDEHNYKITTLDDLNKFSKEMGESEK